jgi:hypothetical protein
MVTRHARELTSGGGRQPTGPLALISTIKGEVTIL